jgi:hypothetical protein
MAGQEANSKEGDPSRQHSGQRGMALKGWPLISLHEAVWRRWSRRHQECESALEAADDPNDQNDNH